jgi:acetate kinase
VPSAARILVVNAGSSSLKLRVLSGDDVVASRDLTADRGTFDRSGLTSFLAGARADAIGHRIVHGGRRFTMPTLIDSEVVRQLGELASLAPLHQAASLVGVEIVGAALPETPAVACFDTAFHATIPPEASTYAVPLEWRERWGVHRYGFHGLSHAYASRRAAQIVGVPLANLRVVVCHLGAGASLCAVLAGRSVDTTMGFTPLDGLVMATRSGSLDPGLVLWLQQEQGLTADDVGEALEHRSGTLAVGGSADMAELLARADRGDSSARLAIAVYVHRLAGGIAGMATSMGGLDLLVFTGGIGENAAPVRRLAADRLGFLGVGIDEAGDEAGPADAEITRAGSPVRTVVVRAREDLEIARGVRSVLSTG